ncbi:hypothetical protein ARMSODRAFT_504140 [Armillaria solidipes]|uniref:Uncharacterized protein n=1 Tax=Armillaria solidipes TaxID=1076256 RepID=A0A2H3BW20_9AGAR|nr:hypothetical protein ARMSODRAFT_504140 [Armillaria solidipes]
MRCTPNRNGTLDSPSRHYSYSQKKAISFVDSRLDDEDVDAGGRCSCRLTDEAFTNPIILRHKELVPPSVAAFAHFCSHTKIRVESGKCLLSCNIYGVVELCLVIQGSQSRIYSYSDNPSFSLKIMSASIHAYTISCSKDSYDHPDVLQ